MEVATEELDMVNQLIYMCTKHVIGQTVVYSNQATEALLGMRCRKMSDFKSYKDTFLACLYNLTSCEDEIWKRKFVEGLPQYIAEKFYQKMSEHFEGNTINWSTLTYGDITSSIQAICLSLCRDTKHN